MTTIKPCSSRSITPGRAMERIGHVNSMFQVTCLSTPPRKIQRRQRVKKEVMLAVARGELSDTPDASVLISTLNNVHKDINHHQIVNSALKRPGLKRDDRGKGVSDGHLVTYPEARNQASFLSNHLASTFSKPHPRCHEEPGRNRVSWSLRFSSPKFGNFISDRSSPGATGFTRALPDSSHTQKEDHTGSPVR